MAKSKFGQLMQPSMMPETSVYAPRKRTTNFGGHPYMNTDQQGLSMLPSDAQAIERQQYGMAQPNRTYSSSYRDSPMDRMLRPRNREQILSQGNGRNALGMTQTLEQASSDPNFNADGRYFQGAKLGMNANGSAYFREGDVQPNYAGGAQNADEAKHRRNVLLMRMESQGKGYVTPNGQFIGNAGAGGGEAGMANAALLRDSTAALAGRTGAGGTTPTSLSAEQLDGNRLAMIQRVAERRQGAMNRVQQMAAQSTEDRRARMAGPSPLQQMLANNPQMAMQMQAQQNMMQNANLDRQNRLDVANAEGGIQRERNKLGGLAALVNAGVPLADAQAMVGMQGVAGQGGAVAGQIPKAKPGSFSGVDKPTYDYLVEAGKNMDDQGIVDLMNEMGIAPDQHAALIARVRPGLWRGMQRRLFGSPAQPVPGEPAAIPENKGIGGIKIFGLPL